jgi:hypothetical protein
VTQERGFKADEAVGDRLEDLWTLLSFELILFARRTGGSSEVILEGIWAAVCKHKKNRYGY